jgi:hypothetical protein
MYFINLNKYMSKNKCFFNNNLKIYKMGGVFKLIKYTWLYYVYILKKVYISQSLFLILIYLIYGKFIYYNNKRFIYSYSFNK